MQALVITAYKDIDQIIRLINSTNKYFKLFIHVDKKSKNIFNSLVKSDYPNIYIYSLYSITWGGYNHLAAIFDLLKIALADPDIDYCHIISGQDFVVKNFLEFESQFEHSEKIYMSCMDVKYVDPRVSDRFRYWIPSSNWNLKRMIPRFFVYILCSFQKVFHLNRKQLGPFITIYKGMIWTSLPKEVIEYVVNFVNRNPSYMKDLRHTRIPEEFFFQTILMNSKYRNQIVSNNLRYTDWTHRNGSTPAILDESDYIRIMESNCFFARKIDSSISMKLIKMLEVSQENNYVL